MSHTLSTRRGRWARGLLPLVAALLVLTLLAPAQAQRPEKDKSDPNQKSNPKVLAAFREVVAKPSRGTVRILCNDKEAALGTVVGGDGWVLTKFSELKGQPVCRLKDGKEYEARLVGVHELHDLALLKIEVKGLISVEWRESKTALVGNWVATPGLSDDPVAVGVVSVATRKVATRGVPPVINSANSGYLGITLETTENGAKIAQVSPRSAAEKAGLKAGDIVITVGGKEIVDAESLINTIQSYKPGDKVLVKVKRGDKEVEMEAILDKRPPNASRSDFQNALGSALSDRRTGFPEFLQHDTVLRPSDCGGPIVDLEGKVIGINIARAGRTESYAVPSETVIPLLFDLMSGKLPPKEVKSAKPLTGAEKVAEAKAAVQRAEADKAAAEKKLAEAKAALEKAEDEAKNEKK